MTQKPPVRRRHVYYVSGFDPNGPSRYRKLYSENARAQAGFTGVEIEVGARTKTDPLTTEWTVHYRQASPAAGTAPAPTTQTHYIFPRWDDIVRDFWWHDNWRQLPDLLNTTWHYLRSGALWKIYRQRWGAFVSVFAPFLLLMVLLPGLVAHGWAGWALSQALVSKLALAESALVFGLVTALAIFWAYWARRHWHSQWILRGYSFIRRMATGKVPALEKRIDDMAAQICRQALKGEDDEILVVGHSVGTIVAVSVLARAFQRDPRLTGHGAAIGLVTLGHCIPLLSNLPEAVGFREELERLGNHADFRWVDFSDALDDYGFAGVDPVMAAGKKSPRADHPQMRSPEVAGLFEPGPHCKPRMDVFAIHQQYLCAGRPGHEYDYFAMTAGEILLADRFPPRVK
jgi:hypothetical protein